MKNILKSEMALEQCDPDVMPYFTDYLWVPVDQLDRLVATILNTVAKNADRLGQLYRRSKE